MGFEGEVIIRLTLGTFGAGGISGLTSGPFTLVAVIPCRRSRWRDRLLVLAVLSGVNFAPQTPETPALIGAWQTWVFLPSITSTEKYCHTQLVLVVVVVLGGAGVGVGAGSGGSGGSGGGGVGAEEVAIRM